MFLEGPSHFFETRNNFIVFLSLILYSGAFLFKGSRTHQIILGTTYRVKRYIMSAQKTLR
jgi:hypothetical protein